MPELPEVESVRLGLVDGLLNKSVATAQSVDARLLLDPESLPIAQLRGFRFACFERRGKYLRMRLNRSVRTSGLDLYLHLGMTGVLRVGCGDGPHLHLTLRCTDGTVLEYRDPRKFGWMCLRNADEGDHPRWAALGPDGLSSGFSAKWLLAHLGSSQRAVKVALLDQSVVAGIGNIYASEALFGAGIHPARRCDSLGIEEWTRIVRSAKQVMRLSLKHRGTTFSDYRLTNGRGGAFQNFLKVFQKEGEPCPRCGQAIARDVQMGRSTFFCAHCQS